MSLSVLWISGLNNSPIWIKKITRNMERDRENEQALRFQEWTVLRFWGEDIRKHTEECVRAVEEAIFATRIGGIEEISHCLER